MNNLAQLQNLMQIQLLHGGGDASALVLGDARADAAQRLGVYADAYRLRLLEVLGNDYETLRALLGADKFERLGRAYIERHPSDTPSVRWFGRHLAGFLRDTVGYSARPALAELASFEWKKSEVFDAPDATALPLAAVAAVPPESWPAMHLLPHPAVRRLDLRWNVPAVCVAHEAGQALPRTRARAHALPWLLWRDEALNIRWRPLGADEAAAIDAMIGGASFGALCELLCEWVEPEQAAMHAAGLLKRWVVDGLIADLEIGN